MNVLKSTTQYFKDVWRRGIDEAGVPVIIYQMGKVGSTSLARSLEHAGVRPTYQVHRVHPERIEDIMERRRQRGFNDNGLPTVHRRGREVYNMVVQPRRHAKFITMARNPVDRNISAFFFNFYRLDDRFKDLSQSEIVRSFLEDYSHEVPLNWFQDSLEKTLDINVFETPFPHERGYVKIEKDPFELLVLRTETPDAVKAESVAEFLGMSTFHIERHNTGASRDYADAYRAFKQNVSLPRSYLDRLLTSQYAQHFYTEEEIDATYRRWS